MSAAVVCADARDLPLPDASVRVKRAQAENALALRHLRSESRQHRTKVTGQKVIVGQYGQRITTPITCLSDEFVARCDALYLRSRELNRVGI